MSATRAVPYLFNAHTFILIKFIAMVVTPPNKNAFVIVYRTAYNGERPYCLLCGCEALDKPSGAAGFGLLSTYPLDRSILLRSYSDHHKIIRRAKENTVLYQDNLKRKYTISGIYFHAINVFTFMIMRSF